jgi:purine-binding chemotaxis protein CheW
VVVSQQLWDDVWAVLHETAEILDQEESSGSLEDRTRQLARRPDNDRLVSHEIARVLMFALGSEQYSWPAQRVRAISRIGRITPVPSAPAYYRGVISLRGQVISVLDLARYLNLPESDRALDFMIVIDGAGLAIGVLASDVYDVVNIPLVDLAPASSAGLDPELIIGMTKTGLTMLDAEALLRRERQRIESEDQNKL